MRTHSYSLAIGLALSTLPLHASATPASDPLWQQARQALDASKNLVADEVATEMEMIDSDGKSLGVMNIVERISEWKNAEPVRTIVSNDNPQYANVARTRFKVSLLDHPDEALRDGSWQRVGTEKLDGKTSVTFAVDGKIKDKSIRSKVWINEETGLPLKVIHDFAGIPMTKSLNEAIVFGRNRDGMWAPASVTVDATVFMLFQKLRIVSKYKIHSWVPRPAAGHQASAL